MVLDVVTGFGHLGELTEQFIVRKCVPRGARDGFGFGSGLSEQHHRRVSALAAYAYGWRANQYACFVARSKTEGAHEGLIGAVNVLNPVGFISHGLILCCPLVLSATA